MARIVATAALVALAACAVGASAGCTTYQDDLARGQKAFEDHDYDRTLAIFRPLEEDISELSKSDRAHYAYLRGMTDYRIGFRADARHWLALAKTLEQETPGVLLPDWKPRLAAALTEMNEAVYTTGFQSLVDDENAGKDTSDDSQAKTQPALLPLAPTDAGANADDAGP